MTDQIPTFPTIDAVIVSGDTGTVTINGMVQPITGADASKVADSQLNRRLHGHFASLTRAGPALVDGGTLNYQALLAETREAWLHVSAAVADGL